MRTALALVAFVLIYCAGLAVGFQWTRDSYGISAMLGICGAAALLTLAWRDK